MKIAVGSDHAGYELKEKIETHLIEQEKDIEDYGTNGNSSVDYPDFAVAVAEAVSKSKIDRGILVCGTGIGMSIAANKFPNVRAALCYDVYSAEMSRKHNNANILVLAGRVLDSDVALKMVDAWLKTEFEGGRHKNRLDKISEIEKKFMKGAK
ncbi:MAG: ribose 5-phosphate isomerase B [Nitrospirae bacterium RBG_19FT_COMBO_42_15]|nr:MAG: ribose 5-phosphate isomerase B [Nitrospirae bacterium RBG_19FT_COMBO_42_15]